VLRARQPSGVRRLLAIVVLFAAACAQPVAAATDWSPVVRPSSANNPRLVAVAADAGGDAAVAWVVAPGARPDSAAVRVAVRRGRSGAWSARLLRSAGGLSVGGVALVVAPSGEVTVAWIDQVGGGHPTVRAAFRTPEGRWSAVQAVGLASPLHYAYPRLAVAADGTVALVYDAGIRLAPGMAVAWRRPGHSFGPIAAVPGGPLSEPTLAFDASGRAFLAGTALCDNESQSHGVVLTAPAWSHRFGRPRTITPHPATEVRFALTGTGEGIAAWLGGGCSTSELLGGPVGARRVTTTGTGTLETLAPAYANDLEMVAAPGGVELTWTGYNGSAVALLVAHVDADGSASAPQMPADGWMPIAADAAGDQLLQTAVAQNFGPSRALAARAANSTAIEPSPLTGPGYWTAAGSPTGLTLIAAATLQGALQIATWTP
jgi:hypothetical protein